MLNCLYFCKDITFLKKEKYILLAFPVSVCLDFFWKEWAYSAEAAIMAKMAKAMITAVLILTAQGQQALLSMDFI